MYVYAIVIIISLLSIFACYALISQTIEKQRLKKHRILMAVKTKHRNLVHMNKGFPQHFLTKDLATLIYSGLVDVCGQLSKIEPTNNRHKLEMASYASQLKEISSVTNPPRVILDNPKLMRDIHQHLQELQRYVLQQAELSVINSRTHSAYQQQIKTINLQLSVDTYSYHAQEAIKTEKLRLAIHYFTLAKKLLDGEKANPQFNAQLSKIESILALLEEKALANEGAEAVAATDNQTLEDSNKKGNAEDKKEVESWKKKQVYD
jgi:hypothetical protein